MTSTQTITDKRWLLLWMALNVLAPISSFIGGYGFVHVFALFYPLFQTLAIRKIKNVKYPWIWMTHFIYWILLLSYIDDYNMALIAILGSSIIGQLLLRIMFDSFGKFNWIIWNTGALGLLIVTTHYLRNYSVSNDFYEILIIILLFLSSSFLSGMGLKLGYMKSTYNSH